ncbi:hypothetical protein QMZ92_31000 [Streptomyces sp. HNM0645]|nr:hypothetical protein [Streptomyces sp. HNM0645]MDI9888670.1 hypothetical protein [Streptomyces sp. HNM0645]
MVCEVCGWRRAGLAVVALDRLETLVRSRLKGLQYRPDTRTASWPASA